MANDRYTGRSDDYGRRGPQDYTSDLQDGRGYGYSSARDYEAAERGGQRRRPTRGQHEGYSRGASSREGFDPVYGGAREDEHRMRRRAMRDLDMERRGHRPHIDNDPDYDPEHRGFFDRAGDEVMSWFGDEDAERRRRLDARYEQAHENHPDRHYADWRRERINELDRDYAEYREENRARFHNDFNNWRTERQGQRGALTRVAEHMEVVGSDGAHVGTVDKVRGDRILLTKNDKDAGGHHHSIPSRWIETVEGQTVTIRKTAEEAQTLWKDEDRNRAFFSDSDFTSEGRDQQSRRYTGIY